MSLKIGTTTSTNIYVGSTPVTKVYVGTTQVYPSASYPILASDSFSAADITTINGTALNYYAGGSVTGLTWVSSANIGIISTKLGPAATSSLKVARVNTSLKNGYSEIVYDTAHGTSVGCVGRYVDASNYYRMTVTTNGTILIEKTIAATTSTLYTSSAGVGGVGKRLGLYVNGSSIAAYIDGVLVQSVTDTDILESANGVYWGVCMLSGSTTGRLDNFRVATGPLP